MISMGNYACCKNFHVANQILWTLVKTSLQVQALSHFFNPRF